MQFNIDIDGDIRALMKREVESGRISVSSAMERIGGKVKAAWRAQIVGAGLGTGLAKSIRDQVYPINQPSLNAAVVVKTKAPTIIAAHDLGPLIRSQSGLWLAIPLPAAGKGAKGAKLTPGQWENKTGRRLRFVYRPGKSGLLVDDGTIRPGNVMVRRGGRLQAPRRIRNRTVPIFVLVRQAKLPKRLNIAALADQGASAAATLIVNGWKD